ncbi:molybdopterin-dependent oxidoreductase [Halioxenophilus sp. WMMB6]|uniref:molybdopterin-containing oxidoreductase family protein n=1 Tax=Halioxenophilus sp. WMMB6 TaxID=3073815 RepID=UPI00295E7DFD|nr:molybdopterin-dependent oxidoreductase [Halioxenophilus sp. WMMB6]
MNKAKTFCRNCGALCSMEVTVDDGRLIAVAADGTASPYGGYMCIKGQSAIRFHNGAEERLQHSLKRNGSGALTAIVAEQALTEIAAQLQQLITQYGPRSIAVYHGTGAYRSVLGAQLEKSFLSAMRSPNLFSTMTIDQSAKWVTSARMGIMASGKPAFADVDLAVIVGNNPVVSHQTYPFGPGESGAPGRSFAEAKKRGTRIVVIDPRATETARYADLFIQPKPGQDAVIFAAVAHLLLKNSGYNHAFCHRFVTQLEALTEAVAPFTPALAAARADIPVAQIERLAEWLAEAQRPFVGSGSGPSMSARSNLNDHMIEVVNALVGGYRQAGDRVRNPGTLNPRRFFETVVPASRSWERGDFCHSQPVGKLFGEFPSALLPQEITTPGANKIRALICFGGNPAMGLGDPAVAIPALQELDLLVCLDARLNETGKLADYVVATSQPFERHDITIPGDSLFPEAFAQYTPPMVLKPAGVIHDWEFFWAVAAKMGLPLTLKYWTYGADFEAIADGLSLPVESRPEEEAMLRFLCQRSRVSFDELKANPSGVRPQLEPQRVQPAASDNGARLQLCPPDVATELAELAQEQPDTRFGYQLTCRRILEAMNSAYREAELTRKRYPLNWAYMNPGDMAREGLAEGDSVQIRSAYGAIVAVVKGEKRLRSGVISMSHMFGSLTASRDPVAEGGSFTGHLTSLTDALEPINFMPLFSGIPVNVAALGSSDQ